MVGGVPGTVTMPSSPLEIASSPPEIEVLLCRPRCGLPGPFFLFLFIFVTCLALAYALALALNAAVGLGVLPHAADELFFFFGRIGRRIFQENAKRSLLMNSLTILQHCK